MTDGILLLGSDLPPDEQRHQHRRQGDCQERRKEHGKCLRVGQGFEEPSRLGLEGEDGKKSHRNDQQREEERRPHFLGRFDNDIHPVPRFPLMLPLLELLVGIFHHDDGGVHHGADGDGNAGEAHDIGGDAQIIHADEGHENGDGQRDDDHQGAGQVKKKDQADHAHRDDQFDNLLFEGGHGSLNEIRTVIGGDDLYPFGKAGRDVAVDLFLYPLDYIQDIFTETDNHNPAGHFTPAVQFRQPSADFRPQLDTGHIL